MKTKYNLIRSYLLVAVLLLPAVAQAQFTFTTNNSAIIITGYSGSGVAAIPNTINGHPVTGINYGAFSFCTGLTGITIPNNVTNIGEQAFYYCTGLTEINVDAGNPAYSSMKGVLFNYSRTTLVDFPGGLGGSYMIPNSVTNIGVKAFYWCVNVTNISLPDSVISVGDLAFSDCLDLTSVTIPNSVTSIGVGAFAACRSLKSILIPNSITNIADIVFESTGLTNLIIPDGVVSIGDSVFSGCSSLNSVTIPASVVSIKEFAFESCSNLKNVFFKGNAPAITAVIFPGDNAATAYYLPQATGWGASYGGIPTVLWNAQAQTNNRHIGVQTNQFSFNITGTTNIPVVVEACTNLGGAWVPLQSVSLTNGSFYFSDPQWTNYPGRFYRLRSP
jgi:hypothetical protein